METEHEFTLIIDGIPELNSEVMDALFEAGCDDATVMMHGGQISMGFDRSAPTMKEAMVSAVMDVRRANIGARVVRIEVSADVLMQGLDGDVPRLIEA
jgi:hypothetical protein